VNVRTWMTVVGCSAVAAPLAAQIGHEPRSSPYIDLEYKQEATFFGGYYIAATDRAGVAPKDGPMVGVRYDLRLGGPALLSTKFGYVFSQRNVIDPRRPEATRVVQANESWPLYMADVGVTLNLTGQRSYRHIVPFLNGGLGIAWDYKDADVGAWKFGIPFAFSFGGGFKWVSSGNLQARVDVFTQYYQIKYPSSYYVPASDGTAVLGPDDNNSDWTGNLGLTLGLSYLFFR